MIISQPEQDANLAEKLRQRSQDLVSWLMRWFESGSLQSAFLTAHMPKFVARRRPEQLAYLVEPPRSYSVLGAYGNLTPLGQNHLDRFTPKPGRMMSKARLLEHMHFRGHDGVAIADIRSWRPKVIRTLPNPKPKTCGKRPRLIDFIEAISQRIVKIQLNTHIVVYTCVLYTVAES